MNAWNATPGARLTDVEEVRDVEGYPPSYEDLQLANERLAGSAWLMEQEMQGMRGRIRELEIQARRVLRAADLQIAKQAARDALYGVLLD